MGGVLGLGWGGGVELLKITHTSGGRHRHKITHKLAGGGGVGGVLELPYTPLGSATGNERMRKLNLASRSVTSATSFERTGLLPL